MNNNKMTEFKGFKTCWRNIENVVRADHIGVSHKICEVNTEMCYPATKEQGDSHLKLILAAPKMFESLSLIANKLYSEEMDVNSQDYKLWKIANDTIEQIKK